jgi:hypothetical protein
MNDRDRFLLLGKYTTPRFRIGQVVICAARGTVVITGVTEARLTHHDSLAGDVAAKATPAPFPTTRTI